MANIVLFVNQKEIRAGNIVLNPAAHGTGIIIIVDIIATITNFGAV